MAERLKHLPAMWETWVQPWVRKIPWRRKMATHSSILVWKMPWTKEPGGLQSMGLQRVEHCWSDWVCTHSYFFRTWWWKMEVQFYKQCQVHKLESVAPLWGLLSNTHPSVFIYSLRNSFVIPSWTWVQGSKIKSIIILILRKNRRHSLQYSFHPFGAASYYSNLSSHTRVDNRILEI